VAARGGCGRTSGHLQGWHSETVQPNDEHMYNVIITKLALTRRTLSAPNSLNIICLWSGEDRNKVEGNEEGERQRKEGKGKLRAHDVFMSISPVRQLSPQFA